MLDPKNVVTLTGGIVAKPEVVNETIVKLRVGVDYAGQSKVDDKKSGYFDVTFYANGDNPNAKFVLSQIEKENFKAGTNVSLVGRLVQERWETDGKKGQRVVIVAESITYAGSNKPAGEKPAEDDGVPLPTKF